MENTLNIENKKYVSTYVKNAFATFKKNWKILILGTIIFYATIFIVEMILVGSFGEIGQIPYQLFVIFMSVGVTRFLLNIHDKRKATIAQIFTGATSRQFLVATGVSLLFGAIAFGIMFLLGAFGLVGLLTTNIVVSATLMLVVLIILTIVFIGISLYLFAIIDRNKGVFASLSYSWTITKGYRFKMFVLGLIAVLILIAGLLALGVGILVALPIVTLIQAQLYRELAGPRSTEIITEVVIDSKEDKSTDEEIIEA